LLQFLQKAGADIICLQEVLAFQLDEILIALSGFSFVGVGRNDGIRDGEIAPIFYRNLDLKASGTTWLSDTPDVPGSMAWGARHPRICTWVEFNGFTVANLHLDHESELARINGVELVIRDLAPDIVCGDFNAPPTETCIYRMQEAGYHDLGSEDGTYNGFNSDPVDPQKIDYVFARPPWNGTAMVVREPLVSDHWAVSAEISTT
jgi:endonuclease/exonuclease/phosphatase family metal-dependent hydrolase